MFIFLPEWPIYLCKMWQRTGPKFITAPIVYLTPFLRGLFPIPPISMLIFWGHNRVVWQPARFEPFCSGQKILCSIYLPSLRILTPDAQVKFFYCIEIELHNYFCFVVAIKDYKLGCLISEILNVKDSYLAFLFNGVRKMIISVAPFRKRLSLSEVTGRSFPVENAEY